MIPLVATTAILLIATAAMIPLIATAAMIPLIATAAFVLIPTVPVASAS
ncbi:hypothetical protein RG963_07055 [Methanosarcina sp. Z-7115]|uniref:Uncharacterized protein n=1 Tax=Methanosarcina baikalica TaxID=3073890 RepID=A0ABU2D0M3_9EURY|nr:hypothetical protein [Methanosarcina sp. Z-7115]MDR7665541.1 hypothetical protein [Methanosarcina sp. Z-7115]